MTIRPRHRDISAKTVGTGGLGTNNVLVRQLLGCSSQKARHFSPLIVTRMQDLAYVFSQIFREWYSRTVTAEGGDPLPHPTPSPAGAPVLGPKPWPPLNFSAVVAPLHRDALPLEAPVALGFNYTRSITHRTTNSTITLRTHNSPTDQIPANSDSECLNLTTWLSYWRLNKFTPPVFFRGREGEWAMPLVLHQILWGYKAHHSRSCTPKYTSFWENVRTYCSFK